MIPFPFVGRRGTAAKALFFDGTGLCIVHKRLDRGTFRVPSPPTHGATHLEIDEAAFETLFDDLPIAPEAADRPSRESQFSGETSDLPPTLLTRPAN